MVDAASELERASADIVLTRDAREILERAAKVATARGDAHVAPADVFNATLQLPGNLADTEIRALGYDPKSIAPLIQANGADASSPSLRQLLVNANREAQVLGHYQVDSIHLLLALMYSDARATSVALQKAGITLYDLRRHLQTGAGSDIPVEAGVHSRQDRALRRKPLVSLRGALGISPIFFGLIAIPAVSGIALWFDVLPGSEAAMTIVFVTSAWIVSVCTHEFGHALFAYLGGDRSVKASGYLTLNPLRYANVLMSVIFPVVF